MTTDNPLGFEPPKIPQGGPLGANWRNGELHDAFQSLTVDQAFEQARQYEAAVNLWEEGVETFARSIHRSISDAWEGVSAEAAKQAITDYTNAAQQLSQPLKDMTNHMSTSAASVVAAKNAIPPGVHIDATSWLWPPHRFDLEDEQGRNRQQGWESYKTLYVEPLGKIDASVPVLPKAADQNHPIDITPGTGYHPPTGPVGPDGPDTNGPETNGPNGPGQDGQPKPDDHPTESTQPQGTAGPDTSPEKPTTPIAAAPDSVRPAGLDAPTTTPSGLSTGTTGSPGGIHTGPGVSGPGVASPGRSIPGTGAAPHNLAAVRADAAAKPGMSGMPGMGVPGRGSKNEDEAVHTTPDYLKNAENTEELLGPDPKTVPGGVIGGEFAAYDRPNEQ